MRMLSTKTERVSPKAWGWDDPACRLALCIHSQQAHWRPCEANRGGHQRYAERDPELVDMARWLHLPFEYHFHA